MYKVQWSKNMKMIREGEQCSAWLLGHSEGEGTGAGSATFHAELGAENVVLFETYIVKYKVCLQLCIRANIKCYHAATHNILRILEEAGPPVKLLGGKGIDNPCCFSRIYVCKYEYTTMRAI